MCVFFIVHGIIRHFIHAGILIRRNFIKKVDRKKDDYSSTIIFVLGFKKGPLPNKTADDTIENLQNAIKTGNILTALPIANEGGKLANVKNSATETIVEENTKENHWRGLNRSKYDL